jgi:hypothetical protein
MINFIFEEFLHFRKLSWRSLDGLYEFIREAYTKNIYGYAFLSYLRFFFCFSFFFFKEKK